MKRWMGKLWGWVIGLFSLAMVLFIAIASNWIADLVSELAGKWDWVTCLSAHPGWALALLVACFGGASLWLYGQKKALFGTRCIGTSRPPARPCLMLFLSPSSPPALAKSGWPIRLQVPGGEKTVELTGDLAADVKASNIKERLPWNWLQMIRALAHHHDGASRRLGRIVLIVSNESDAFRDDAARLIGHYVAGVRVTASEPVDFEDFEGLKRVVKAELDGLKKEGQGPGDIILDITGGQKTASIVAANATINSSVVFQYVSTNHPYQVLGYDLQHEVPWD